MVAYWHPRFEIADITMHYIIILNWCVDFRTAYAVRSLQWFYAPRLLVLGDFFASMIII